jgi:hypothetical protein
MTYAMMALRRRRSTVMRMRYRYMLHKLRSTDGEACGLDEMSAFVVAIARRTTEKMSSMFSMLVRVVSTNESGAAFQKMSRAVIVMAMMTVR